MRYFTLTVVVILGLLLTSCGDAGIPSLDYQNGALHIEAEVSEDGSVLPLTVELAAAEFDENGKMYARDASVTVGEGSIISGIRFEAVSGEYYICSQDIRIPITDEATVSGIREVISLFCVREESYYSAEDCVEHEDCTVAVYKNGGNSIDIHLSGDGLPTRIVALIGGRETVADISVFTVG